MALNETEVLQTMLALISDYPWNNALQIKVHDIFNELLGNKQNDSKMKLEILRCSQVVMYLVQDAKKNVYTFGNENIA